QRRRKRSQEHRPTRDKKHGKQDLHGPQPENMSPHGFELRQVEFQADDEHQENHTKLCQVTHPFRVLRQGQGIRPNQDANSQVAQDGR
ncbi:MAG: hypothetical protein RIS60_1758, partial [Pseudomonadota bacterium]